MLGRSKWGWVLAGLVVALGIGLVLVAEGLGGRNMSVARVLLLAALGWLGLLAIFVVAIGRFHARRATPAAADPQPHGRITVTTRLAELPALALDTETTGLDPVRDRIVSLGAVRLRGPELLRDAVLDLLVNPGRRIPGAATAIHGISDPMVREAPSYFEAAPQIMAALAGHALIGHHTVFDLAMLRRASTAIGIDWQDPPWLDTALLYSALDPEAQAFDLDAVAAKLGVAIHGRHTALGDAMATAEIYLKLLPELEAHGIVTLGEAMAFQMTSRKAARAHQMARAFGP